MYIPSLHRQLMNLLNLPFPKTPALGNRPAGLMEEKQQKNEYKPLWPALTNLTQTLLKGLGSWSKVCSGTLQGLPIRGHFWDIQITELTLALTATLLQATPHPAHLIISITKVLSSVLPNVSAAQWVNFICNFMCSPQINTFTNYYSLLCLLVLIQLIIVLIAFIYGCLDVCVSSCECS